MSDTTTMHELEANLREEIRDNAAFLLKEVYPEDSITEYVDSSVPVYTSTLMELAASNPWLATAEPEILAFDGTPSPVNAVAGNIYEALTEAAAEEWKSITDEAEPCVECGELTLEGDGVLVNVEAMTHEYPGYAGDLACNECAGVPE